MINISASANIYLMSYHILLFMILMTIATISDIYRDIYYRKYPCLFILYRKIFDWFLLDVSGNKISAHLLCGVKPAASVSSGWRITVAILIRIPDRNSYRVSTDLSPLAHSRSNMPHLEVGEGARMSVRGLHIILSGSGSRADSPAIVYDGTWTTPHAPRVHISRLSCSECTGAPGFAAAVVQRCSWSRGEMLLPIKRIAPD